MYKLSKYISTVLHPVLLPTLATLIFFIVSPEYYPSKQIYVIVIFVFLGSYILPLLLLVLFKKLHLISSFEIKDTRERKIPVFSFLTISLILGNVIYSLPGYKILSLLFLGCFIALAIVYLLLFLNFKTSLHLVGISGFTTFIILISFFFNINLIGLIALLLLLTGFLATARLILDAHKPIELIIGFFIGVFSIVIIASVLL